MRIYRVLNKLSGKSYVGQTIHDISWRWRGHVRAARLNSRLPVHCAIRSYGEDAFEISVLEECSSQEDLDVAERRWIVELNSINDGYNLVEGGRTSRVLRGENHPRFGKHLTTEHRAKISAASIGKRMSPTACARMSEAAKGKKHPHRGNPGHEVSTETRQKISAATSHPITQMTFEGHVVKEWKSITEAALTLGYARTKMSATIKRGKPYRGFLWKYSSEHADET